MGTAEEIARALEGVREGHNYRCLCPVHGGHSLSVAEGRNGKLLIYCFQGCSYTEIFAALAEMGPATDTASQRDIIKRCFGSCNKPAERECSIDAALNIYCQAQPAEPVKTYAYSRGITIPVPEELRFLSRAPHRAGWYFPAMIALVTGLDGPLGIHMTFLRLNGNGKYPFPDKSLQRECRGPIAGGAVRLAPFRSGELVVTEGIETGLACMELFDLPAWAALSTSGLRTLELPIEVRNVAIAMDNDVNSAGQIAALSSFTRWKDQGRRVRLLMPPTPGDFNDVLLSRGA